jgi:ATP-dependent Clp protease ATP-binding subunit ClpC
MFERFTDRARRVLVLAQEEARLLGHPFIGTEHILLGLLAEGDGVAARALSLLGVHLEPTRARVGAILGSSATGATTGSPPFTPRAKKTLELALRESLQLGHHYIGTEHMLLGLLREGEGVACQVLVGMGVDLRSVRQEVVDLIGVEGHPVPNEGPVTARGMASPRREEAGWLRADIEAALTSEPGSALLRRYQTGELSAEEAGGDAVLHALADLMIRQQELLRRLAEYLLPPPA